MARVFFVALLSAAGFVLSSPSAYSSCDSEIETRSRHLSFMYYEIYPLTEADDSTAAKGNEGALSWLWERLARGLATAVNCQRRIETDAQLSKMLSAAPIALTSQFGGPIQPTSDIAPLDPVPSDSLVALFHGLDRDSSAVLFSVLLGSFGRKSAAESFMMDLGYSPDEYEEDSDAHMDTTMVMDIVYSDCVQEFDHAELFMLPPELTADGKVWVLSGIYYSRDDAQHSVSKHWLPGKKKGKVTQIRFTGPVLRNAFPRP